MSTTGVSLLLPLLAQVLLTLIVFVLLAVAKARAAKQGLVDHDRRALHDDAWPENVQQINNNIRNQFELPVLFYVLVLVLIQSGATGVLPHVLAWLFVGSRVVHAGIHIGPNYVPARRAIFMAGTVIVLAMLCVAILAIF